MASKKPRSIRIRGGNANNLNSVDVDFPIGKWTTVCGVSGSGKTSLVFDTLLEESQRRFLSTLSPSIRRYLYSSQQPDVEKIENLLPAISQRAEQGVYGSQITVGSNSEIDELLRVLFAECAIGRCSNCEGPVEPSSPEAVLEFLDSLEPGLRFQIVFELDTAADTWRTDFEYWRNEGFNRVILGGQSLAISELLHDPKLAIGTTHAPLIVVDRLISGNAEDKRLLDSLELAFFHGNRSCQLLFQASALPTAPPLGEENGTRYFFSEANGCRNCGLVFQDLCRELFDEKTSLGVCPSCRLDRKGGRIHEPSVDCEKCKGPEFTRTSLCSTSPIEPFHRFNR